MQDDNFFVKEERAINIISQLKKINIQSDYIQMRIEKVEDWIIKALIENNVERLFIGWESANPRILELINKNITREQLIEKFTLLSKFPKISTNGSAIIGFPTETWDEIGITVDFTLFISKLIPGALINLCTYLPYPGSPIYELAKKEGFQPPKRQLDWGVFDLFDSRKLELTWLPWVGKNERERFYRLDKYAQLLNHAKSTSLLRTLVKKIFYHFARFRLKHRFFKYPFEIIIQERFANTTKYGIPLAGNKGKFSRETKEGAGTDNAGKIKILHLIESLGCGGAEKRLVSDLQNLDKSRFDNVVCFLYKDDYYKQDILNQKIPVYSLGMKNIYDWPHGIFRLAAIIREQRIDIIHSQLFAANIYGRILAKFMAKPIVSTLQSCDYEPDNYLYSRKRQIVDRVTSKLASDKFIAVSDFVKESYIKRLGLKSEKFEVVYNSVDFDNFKAESPQEIERLRSELGINKETIVVLNIGRLDPPKGQKNLLSAFAKAASTLNNAKLLIVGIGPLEPELKELRDNLGLSDKVSFLGLRADVGKLLQLCDIYISTSFREGFSMSVLEALYMKKPSIISRMVYMPEVLEDRVSAFLVDPDDIPGIAERIIEVARSRQIAESVAQKGHLLVKENFDASKNVKLLENVYLELKKELVSRGKI
jgi:glycosyltransferase involved in cell wall biosynthesis